MYQDESRTRTHLHNFHTIKRKKHLRNRSIQRQKFQQLKKISKIWSLSVPSLWQKIRQEIMKLNRIKLYNIHWEDTTLMCHKLQKWTQPVRNIALGKMLSRSIKWDNLVEDQMELHYLKIEWAKIKLK